MKNPIPVIASTPSSWEDGVLVLREIGESLLRRTGGENVPYYAGRVISAGPYEWGDCHVASLLAMTGGQREA